jgi:uncharacterized Zn finger protein
MRLPSYRFSLRCPRCSKRSDVTVARAKGETLELPVVNCGDCLMDATEVVQFTIVSVDVLS